MAIFRVDSNVVGGDGSGDSWVNAYTNLEACLAHANTIAGSDVYIDDGSAYAYSGNATYSSKGTLDSPINIYCVDKADDSYSTGAIEDASGGVYDIIFDGYANFYGIHFKSGDDLKAGAGDYTTCQFTDCHLELAGAGASDAFFGTSSSFGVCWRLFNTNVTFANAAHGISIYRAEVFEWFGGVLSFNINELVEAHISYGGLCRIRGVDLSVMTGSGTKFLFNGFGGATNMAGFYGEVLGSKLNAANPPVLVQDIPAVDGVYLAMIGCGSAGVPQTHIHTSQGDIIHSIANNPRRIAKYDGTNLYSYKMTSNANIDYHTPLRFKLCEQWMAADPIITAHFTHDINGDGSDAQDNQIWLEIEYPTLNNAVYTQWDRSSRMATLGSPSDLTTEAGVDGWTNGAGAYNSVAVTIGDGVKPDGHAGVHKVWVCSAVPSTKIIYACPKVVVT